MKKTVHFVSGLPFSGSTLLCNLIAQHSDVYATGTSGMHLIGFNGRQYFSSEEFKSLPDPRSGIDLYESFVRAGVDHCYEKITNKPIVVDKCRAWVGHLDSLFSIFPDAKVIVPVRSAIGILSSFEKKFRKNPHSIHPVEMARPSDWTTPEKRAKAALENAPISTALERVLASRRYADRLLYVHFDNLTSNPHREMARVWNYLEVKPPKHDFNNVQQSTNEIDVGFPFGTHIIRPKVAPVSDISSTLFNDQFCNIINANFNWISEL